MAKKQPSSNPGPTMPEPGANLHAPPIGVGALAQAWHTELKTTFGIVDHDGLLVLHQLVAAFDRAERAAALVQLHGELIDGPGGWKRANPAAAIERDARSQVAQALRRLDISPTEPARPGRPAGPGR